LHHLATDSWHGIDGVQTCQNFHMDSRGWNDIAYSFLVDEDLTIYEGRGAGVIGGHTAGDNSKSHAICVMGNYQDHAPADPVIATIAELVRHGHERGWWPDQLTGGHRDAIIYSPLNNTACPGNALHPLILNINTLATGSTIPIEPTPQPQPEPSAPPFPLPAGWYFGPRGGPNESVSGYHGNGEHLAVWQARMAERGWSIDADGRYGPQTAGVALAFQREKGLIADSLIGPQTWRAAWELPVT
jgi:hypothetical protein